MPWVEFCSGLVLALILGCVIGFERQWRQRTAGMRTNTLVALGSVLFVVGTVAVLAANILLRPIAQRFLRPAPSAAESKTIYQLIAVCRAEDEQKMRALLMHTVNASSLKIHSLLSEDADNPVKVEISEEMAGTGTDHTAMEQLVSRLSLEAGVSAVSWEIVTQEEI